MFRWFDLSLPGTARIVRYSGINWPFGLNITKLSKKMINHTFAYMFMGQDFCSNPFMTFKKLYVGKKINI